MLTIIATPKQRVNFQPVDSYKIDHIKNWETWNCGKEVEDKRCDEVRAGHLTWTGSYKVTFINAGKHLSFFSLFCLLLDSTIRVG